MEAPPLASERVVPVAPVAVFLRLRVVVENNSWADRSDGFGAFLNFQTITEASFKRVRLYMDNPIIKKSSSCFFIKTQIDLGIRSRGKLLLTGAQSAQRGWADVRRTAETQ